MVWAEPSGLEIIVPGDRDPSATPAQDSRDFIRISGDLPPELQPYMTTAILYQNGSFDPNNNVSAQLKYYGIGGGAGNGSIGSFFSFYYIVNYGDVPGNNRLINTGSNSVEVQSAARALYQTLGSADTSITQVLKAQAPISDLLHGNVVYPPGTNYVIDGVSRTVLGNLLSGWVQDPDRELLGIYKDVTGRCWMQGFVYVGVGHSPSSDMIQFAQDGPWAPPNEAARARSFVLPVYIPSIGQFHSGYGYISNLRRLVYVRGTTYDNSRPVVVCLDQVNWQYSAPMFGA